MKRTVRILALVLVLVMALTALPAFGAESKTYVLDAAADLQPMEEYTKADYETATAGTDGFFTIHFSEKTKIDSSSKTFEDGYASEQRLNFAGKAQVGNNKKNCVEFTVDAPATVKIWWVQAGDDNRSMGIYDSEKNIVDQTELTLAKNEIAPVTTLEIPAAGTYFLGGIENKNYIFKIEVTVQGSEPVNPEPPITGDSISIFVALMAAAAMGITVLSKKKF